MFSTIRQSLDTFTYACLIEGPNYPLQVHCLHHIHFGKVRPCLQYGFSLQTETNYRLADKMHKRRNCLTTQTYGLCSNGRGSNLLWTSLIATPATALCTAYRKYCLVKKKSFLKSVLTWSQSCKTFCPFSFSNENHMWTPIPTSYDRGSYPRTDYLMCVKSLFVLYITG